MSIHFGREICGELAIAESREWLVTNGIGGYASGTIAGLLTRRYHGLLVAALKPPLGRTLLLAKLDETVRYQGNFYPLATNRWIGNAVDPAGYRHIESFHLDGTLPVWQFACGDSLLEKQLWMQRGKNTTYVRYTLLRGSSPLTLSIKAMVNYRHHHGDTAGRDWRMEIKPIACGICVAAFEGAVPFYLTADRGDFAPTHDWYLGFDLAMERYRGLRDREDHLHAATFGAILQPGESLTFIASTDIASTEKTTPDTWPATSDPLEDQRHYEQQLLQQWYSTPNLSTQSAPLWIEQLVLAADQFIVNRSRPDIPNGKTIIAGYPWFGDWGRDTMIALPGLTCATGQLEVARIILLTFARYLDRGMLPNLFPEAGETPAYNTVDAILWYFEAIRTYDAVARDDRLLGELFPILAEVIDWHRRGTRYNIHLDPDDGLIYAGEIGLQLTWMDAKIGDWVVTPRIGKPVEINALWHNALQIMVQIAQRLGQPAQPYQQLAEQAARGFERFWNAAAGYCYDVLDGPDGDDASLRPNQILAVSLPTSIGLAETDTRSALLTPERQRSVVNACSRALLTSYGLRSLAPDHPDYRGRYGGDRYQRDGAYHQGTVWGWLLGPFVQAHLRVYRNPVQALQLLAPMADQMRSHGIGTLSELSDGDAPMIPRGCIAQAWTVAEVLRVWLAARELQN